MGVRGRELEPFTDKRFPDTLLCLLEVGVFPVVLTAVLRGMRLTFVESSEINRNIKKVHIPNIKTNKSLLIFHKYLPVLSNDCVEP